MKILNTFIKNNTDLVKDMKTCLYHYNKNNLNLHHLESNVWTHTVMSYYNTIKYKYSDYVKWAILLHDIGRTLTRKENRLQEHVSFGDFEGVSIFLSIDILNKTNLSNNEKIKIMKIISYQYLVINFIKYDKPTKNKLINIFKYEEDILQNLAQYVRCDLLGRKVDESLIHLYDKTKMKDFINYTKTISTSKQDIKNNKYLINILVGPPCSKKSTWVKKHKKNAIIVNRDSCIEEIGKKYNKHNHDDAYYYIKSNKDAKIEIDTLYKKRKNYAKNSINKNIIIDNPNLELKSRKEWIDVFKDTHIIKVILFLSSFNDLVKCCEKRGIETNKNITKKELLNKLKTFTYPLLNEGINFINYED
ncbi:MAG: hypothetical protein COB17_10445 [Sulfurimonas sp.]|nr:MAG: hypothetical protein COB17_10445 [Sulfurimonas sp.]